VALVGGSRAVVTEEGRSMSRSVFFVHTPDVAHGRWAERFAWHGRGGSVIPLHHGRTLAMCAFAGGAHLAVRRYETRGTVAEAAAAVMMMLVLLRGSLLHGHVC